MKEGNKTIRKNELPISVGEQFEVTFDDIKASYEPIRHAIECIYENVLRVDIRHGMAYISIGEPPNIKSYNYNMTRRLFQWVMAEWENPLAVNPITIGVTETSGHFTLDIVESVNMLPPIIAI